MDTLIVKIMNFAQKLVDADRASLFLVDSKTNQLYARIFDIQSSTMSTDEFGEITGAIEEAAAEEEDEEDVEDDASTLDGDEDEEERRERKMEAKLKKKIRRQKEKKTEKENQGFAREIRCNFKYRSRNYCQKLMCAVSEKKVSRRRGHCRICG